MNRRIALLAVIGSGLCAVSGQQPVRPGVFTTAQAEAGRAAYEKTCARCHTPALMGRKGDPGELPPLESLSAADQEFIKMYGPVPALAGKEFVGRWQDKTVAQVIARFQEGINAFPPEGTNGETAVEISAYALQVSGAKAGDRPLTRGVQTIIGSMTR